MKRAASSIAGLVVWVCLAPFGSMGAQAFPQRAQAVPEAVFSRPPAGPYRHCGGACLKSGELSWYCRPAQSCAIDCATAPPVMRCVDR